MAKRKQYPLRIDTEVWEALEKWSADDLRSVNAQVEFLLRKTLKEAGRLGKKERDVSGEDGGS